MADPNKKVCDAYPMVSIGADPEIFLEKHGKIIGAEKVFPQRTVRKMKSTFDNSEYEVGEVTLDGVQLELHPKPVYCRGHAYENFRDCFITVEERLRVDEDLKVSMKAVVEVDEKEMESLRPESKLLGCSPSENIYHDTVRLDPANTNTLIRSAGGHLHFSANGDYGFRTNQLRFALKRDAQETVKVLDIMLGNTCVLLDREPLAAKRRQYYGRAGEYRLPVYGLEYRTLSNFWLQANWLQHLVYGIARAAIGVAANFTMGKKPTNYGLMWVDLPPEKGSDFQKELLSLMDMEKVQRAINTNDYDLALSNYNRWIGWYLENHYPEKSFLSTSNHVKALTHLIEKGIDKWLPKENIVTHWVNTSYRSEGWDRFAHTLSAKVAA